MKFKKIMFTTLIAACALVVFAGCNVSPKKYIQELEASGLFDNTQAESLPQTAFHDLVMEYFEEPLSEGKSIKRALVLTADGMRADALPILQEGKGILRYSGAELGGLYFAYAGGPVKSFRTDTAPGTASLLTGVWADAAGVTDNQSAKGVDPKTFMLKLAEEKNIASTFFVNWNSHVNVQYKAELDYAAEKKLPIRLGYTVGKDKDGVEEERNYLPDAEIQNELIKAIAGDEQLLVGLYGEPDDAGHTYGFSLKQPEYVAAAQGVNLYFEALIQLIEARPENEEWLILIATDHGGHGKVHHTGSITERTIFIASNRTVDYTKYKEDAFKPVKL